MLNKLIKIANQLDQKGFHKEADEIDEVIRIAMSSSSLIKALKDNDQSEAMNAFLYIAQSSKGAANEAMNLSREKYNDLANALQSGDLEYARDILGIGHFETSMTDKRFDSPETHNPMTGKPWPSGPVEKNYTKDMLKDLKAIDDQYNLIYESSNISRQGFIWLKARNADTYSLYASFKRIAAKLGFVEKDHVVPGEYMYSKKYADSTTNILQFGTNLIFFFNINDEEETKQFLTILKEDFA